MTVTRLSPNLNERAARLIGERVHVETAIENGRGRVKVRLPSCLARARHQTTPVVEVILAEFEDGRRSALAFEADGCVTR